VVDSLRDYLVFCFDVESLTGGPCGYFRLEHTVVSQWLFASFFLWALNNIKAGSR